jgi:hypothetical protein
MCTDAYREALMRDLSSTVSAAPTPTPIPTTVPSRPHATEAGREGVVARSLRVDSQLIPTGEQ